VTVEEALARHDLDWDRLEKLARRALRHRMAQRRITLDEERFQRALEHYIDVGAAWALDYDANKANGVSFATSCYRRMLPRLTDFLRAEHGDERRGNPIYVQTTATGELPERTIIDEETFEQLVDEVSPRLQARALWTLRHIARAIVVEGVPSMVIATRHGLEPRQVAEHLNELGAALGYPIGGAA